MNDGWMTFRADIRTRPDVAEVGPYLTHGVRAVRAHPDIADATCEHDPTTLTVRFHVQLHHSGFIHHDALTAHRALHEALEQAGFGDTSLPARSPVPVRLRIDWWPLTS
jgi:hypothetical protein